MAVQGHAAEVTGPQGAVLGAHVIVLISGVREEAIDAGAGRGLANRFRFPAIAARENIFYALIRWQLGRLASP